MEYNISPVTSKLPKNPSFKQKLKNITLNSTKLRLKNYQTKNLYTKNLSNIYNKTYK